jgi:hypothetical protein
MRIFISIVFAAAIIVGAGIWVKIHYRKPAINSVSNQP